MMSGPSSNTRNQDEARKIEDNSATDRMAVLQREMTTLRNHVRESQTTAEENEERLLTQIRELWTTDSAQNGEVAQLSGMAPVAPIKNAENTLEAPDRNVQDEVSSQEPILQRKPRS